MTQKQIAFLRDMKHRLKTHSNGASLFFRNAGMIYKGDYPTLVDCERLRKFNIDEFNNLVKFLYPEYANAEGDQTADEAVKEVKAVEDAKKTADEKTDGNTEKKKSSFDWNKFFENGTKTAGSVLTSIFGKDKSEAEAEAAKSALDESKKTLYIILGIVAFFVIAAVVVLAVKKH